MNSSYKLESKLDLNIKKMSDSNERLGYFLKNPEQYFRNARNYNMDGTLKGNYFVSKIKDKQEESENFNHSSNILWRSRYGKIKNDVLNDNILNMVRITDFLIFNKNYVIDDLITLERLLGACYFTSKDNYNHDHCIIDGWEVEGGLGFNRINYHDDYKFSRQNLSHCDYDKLAVGRALITLMNETNPLDLNFTNYFWVDEWLSQNEIFLRYLKHHELVNKMPFVDLKDSQFIFKVDQVLTKDFIQNEVNEALKNDLNLVNNILNIPEQCEIGSHVIEVDENGCVNLKKLRDLLHDSTLKSLVLYRLKKYRDDHIYCEDASAEEMLMELYNTQGPTGFGIVQFNAESLSREMACKLLEKNKYFDYLYGVRMKLNFNMYPLLNIGEYDKYYGDGSAAKCLQNIKNKKLTKREMCNLKFYG
jgi:hypothetical protein